MSMMMAQREVIVSNKFLRFGCLLSGFVLLLGAARLFLGGLQEPPSILWGPLIGIIFGSWGFAIVNGSVLYFMALLPLVITKKWSYAVSALGLLIWLILGSALCASGV